MLPIVAAAERPRPDRAPRETARAGLSPQDLALRPEPVFEVSILHRSDGLGQFVGAARDAQLDLIEILA
jgi:hypothetical protein